MKGIYNQSIISRKIPAGILCAICWFSFNTSARALDGVWEPLGPEGGNFSAAVVNPTDENQVTAFTIDPTNVYRTNDGGNHWIKLGQIVETDGNIVERFYIHDFSTIYAISYTTLYRSDDGGSTWKLFPFPYEEGYPTKICTHPTDPHRLYAIGYFYNWDDVSTYSLQMAFFQSRDGGKTWSVKHYPSYDPFYPNDMAVSSKNPDVILVTGAIESERASANLLLKSSDSGETWNDISSTIGLNEGEYINFATIDPSDENHLFVSTSGVYSIYDSRDGGKTWKKGVFQFYIVGLYMNHFFIHPANPQKIFVGGDGALFYTNDGSHWNSSTTSKIAGYSNDMAFSPSNPSVMYLCTSYALYKSTDGGTTWKTAHTGIYNSTVSTLAMAPSDPKTLYIGYKGVNVLHSRDGGSTWNETTSFLDCGNICAIAIHPNNPDRVLALEGFG